MESTSVNCSNCAAPLEVGAGAEYATCPSCGSRQTIEWTASAAPTAGTRQDELERIDRVWEEERKGCLWTDKRGSTHEPRVIDGIAIAFIGGLLGIVMVVVGIPAAPRPRGGVVGALYVGLACFGLVTVLGAVLMGYGMVRMARAFEQARARYQQRRAAAATKPKPEPGRPPGEIVF